MGFISNIKIRNVFESLATVRKSKIVQKASSSRLVKVVHIALKKTLRKHIHKIIRNDNDQEQHVVEVNHTGPASIIPLASVESPIGSNIDAGFAQSLTEELLQDNDFHEEATVNAADAATDNIVNSSSPTRVQQPRSKFSPDHLRTLPEGLFYQSAFDHEAMAPTANTTDDNDDVDGNSLNNLHHSESNINIDPMGSLLEGLPYQYAPDQEAFMTVTDAAENDIAYNTDPVNAYSQEVARLAVSESTSMPQAEWFCNATQSAMNLSNTQDVQDSRFSTDALLNDQSQEAFVPMSAGSFKDNDNREQVEANDTNIAKDKFILPENFMKLVDPPSWIRMDFEKELLVAKCIDPSLNTDEWIPIAEGLLGQNYATRYLPTIIHENKKTLSKFVRAFRDDPANREIFRSLKLAEVAFESLEKHFKKAGLADCVVEFLKPANHPKRILEELQRSRREYQALWEKYFASQGELDALTKSVNRGTALHQQLGAEGKTSMSSEVEELKKQVQELEAEREKAELLKTMQEFEHEQEVAELKERLRQVECRQILTPEQLRGEALNQALHEAEDMKRLYADSCHEIMQLRNELVLAQQYGLEIGTIATQAEKLDEMCFPKTVWSPPPKRNSFFLEPLGGAEQVAESKTGKNSYTGWTDDSEIF